MNTQEKTALESLISKLNSLRKTLNDDERKILDSMVVVDLTDEVSLHSLPPEGVIPPDQALPPEGVIPPDQALPPEGKDEVSLHYLPEDVVIIFDPETETYKVVRRSIE